jgi:hypothetical protein
MPHKHPPIVVSLWHISVAVSLLFCVVICAAWVGSYWRTSSVRYTSAANRYWVFLDRGVVQLEFTAGDTGDQGWAWNDYRRRAAWGRDELSAFGNGFWARMGFATWEGDCADNEHFLNPLPFRSWIAPLWVGVVGTMVLPGVWGWKVGRRRRRTREGLCEGCGYDLRASGERCPECGRVIPAVRAAT